MSTIKSCWTIALFLYDKFFYTKDSRMLLVVNVPLHSTVAISRANFLWLV